MKNLTTQLLAILFCLMVGGQAFAANLDTTRQWRQWESDVAFLQRLENQAYQAAHQGTSSGCHRAAIIYRQMAQIHLNWARGWEGMARNYPDATIRSQAAYQARSRNIHAQQLQRNADQLDQLANNLARQGR
ncbi:MAG: hypothetical protein KC910_04365 [Candidatus Eremiobacteraeota bacterium]|nr:hypothetical protein [Candidatus Eremiobacteraeota bacterium]